LPVTKQITQILIYYIVKLFILVRSKDLSVKTLEVQVDNNEIIKIAKQRFFEVGIRKTEMKDIANLMNIGRSSLYRHFVSKEAISFYIGIDIIKDLTEPLFQPENPSGTGYERLEAAMKAFVEKLIANPQEVRFLDEFDELFSGAYPENDASNAYTE